LLLGLEQRGVGIKQYVLPFGFEIANDLGKLLVEGRLTKATSR
jgi:hypothetical protein